MRATSRHPTHRRRSTADPTAAPRRGRRLLLGGVVGLRCRLWRSRRLGGGLGLRRRLRLGRRLLGFGLRLGLVGGRLLIRRWRVGGVADHGELRAHIDRVTLLHQDLGHRAAHRRRHLRIDLVGRHLEQRLILRHRVAHLLEPPGDRPLGDGLPELRHLDISHGPDSTGVGSRPERDHGADELRPYRPACGTDGTMFVTGRGSVHPPASRRFPPASRPGPTVVVPGVPEHPIPLRLQQPIPLTIPPGGARPSHVVSAVELDIETFERPGEVELDDRTVGEADDVVELRPGDAGLRQIPEDEPFEVRVRDLSGQ